MSLDPYEILGITKYSSKQEITKHYRRLLKKHHPDTGDGDVDRLLSIQNAYKSLSFDEPCDIITLKVSVVVSEEQLALMIGKECEINSHKIDYTFRVKIPYSCRVGDTLVVKNIAENTNLKILFQGI